jgi:hypothetical protein
MTASEIYGRDVPFWLRLLGCWGIVNSGRSLRCHWGEISLRFGLALDFSVNDEDAHLHVHLIWPGLYFKIPLPRYPDGEGRTYGFCFFDSGLHLHWRTACKVVYLPWDWTHVRHEVFDRAGQRHPYVPEWNDPIKPDARHKETHPYRYVLKSGEVQRRMATIHGEEREWRWRWLRWLPDWFPQPRRIQRCISVDFDGEVGERTGSWKGGTIGCGFEWRHGETMLEALRRMEAERKFD